MAKVDRNTSFFHRKVAQRRRRNRITGVQKAKGDWCQDQGELATEFVTYFQNLFQTEGTSHVEEVLIR